MLLALRIARHSRCRRLARQNLRQQSLNCCCQVKARDMCSPSCQHSADDLTFAECCMAGMSQSSRTCGLRHKQRTASAHLVIKLWHMILKRMVVARSREKTGRKRPRQNTRQLLCMLTQGRQAHGQVYLHSNGRNTITRRHRSRRRCTGVAGGLYSKNVMRKARDKGADGCPISP